NAPAGVLADLGRLGQEVEHRAAGEFGLTAAARGQQLGPARAELGVESGDEVDGLRRKDLVVTITVRTSDLHAFGSRHVSSSLKSGLHPRVGKEERRGGYEGEAGLGSGERAGRAVTNRIPRRPVLPSGPLCRGFANASEGRPKGRRCPLTRQFE